MGWEKVKNEETEAARAEEDPENSDGEEEAECDSWGSNRGVELRAVIVHWLVLR